MSAITKLTLRGQCFDVIEFGLDASRGIPQFQPPQAGRIDQRPTFLSREQLAMCCCMTAATIVGTDFLGLLLSSPHQLIDQCRLANARRTYEDNRPISAEISRHFPNAIGITSGDDVNREARRNPFKVSNGSTAEISGRRLAMSSA